MSGAHSHRPEQQVQKRGGGPEAQPSGGGPQSGMRTQLKRAGSYAAGRAIVQPKTQDGGDDKAEGFRISEELKKVAQRNAWTGVLRYYKQLQQLENYEMTAENYAIASQGFRFVGDTQAQKDALEKAQALAPGDVDIQNSLEGFDAQYGTVHVTSTKKKRKGSSVNAAIVGKFPFAPDQRKSLEHMFKTVNETGNFHGMIPANVAFTLNGEELMVEAGGSVSWTADTGKSDKKSKGGKEEAAPEAAAEAPKVNDRARDKAYADMDQAIEWNTPAAIIFQFEELQKLGVDIPDHYQQAYDKAKSGEAVDQEG